MSSANHTLNSLRYAERLKEKSQGGQGASGSKGFKGLSQDQVNEELRLFMEKHGKEIITEDDMNDMMHQKQTGSLNFYNDNRMDEIMEGNDQDDLLNEDGDDDLLMQ